MSTEADTQARPASRAAAAVRDLHPGHFAFVMATGIISTGTFLLGPSWLSWALLAAAAFLARFACHPAEPPSRAQAPSSGIAAPYDMTAKKELP